MVRGLRVGPVVWAGMRDCLVLVGVVGLVARAFPVLAATLVAVVMVGCCGGPVGPARVAGRVGPVSVGSVVLVVLVACSAGMGVMVGLAVPGRVGPVVPVVLVVMRGCSVLVGLVAWVAPVLGSRVTRVCRSVVRVVMVGAVAC